MKRERREAEGMIVIVAFKGDWVWIKKGPPDVRIRRRCEMAVSASTE
jgi:hypothetical protein